MENTKQYLEASLNLLIENDKAARNSALASQDRFQQAELEKQKRFKEMVASTIASWE
jgi:hypothetical protein